MVPQQLNEERMLEAYDLARTIYAEVYPYLIPGTEHTWVLKVYDHDGKDQGAWGSLEALKNYVGELAATHRSKG